MSPIIRAAERADLPQLASLFDLYRQFYAQAPDARLAHDFIHERFERGDSVLLVAAAGSADVPELAAFCQLYPSYCSVAAAPIYVLYDLFVAPTARRFGLGRLLLLAAETRARADGKARMDLSTAKTNHAAQALYESLGWERDEAFFTYSRTLA